MTAPVIEDTGTWPLVQRAQAGDTDAFAEIYSLYVDVVFRWICFRVRNRHLAEDLTSEVFLRALRNIGRFTWQGRDFGAWLHTIARNLVADHFKSGRHRLEALTADGAMPDRVDPEPGTAEQVIARLTAVDLTAAMRHLGDEQRQCLVLRFYNDCSVTETALAMGKNEGAVKALQYRAVRALLKHLPEGLR